jgi:TPR repeat protein
MKKLLIALLLLTSAIAFADFTIIHTRFRKSELEIVQQYAKQGDAEAQLELAQRFFAGHQVVQNLHKAFEWMERSASGGDADAQFLLSEMLRKGVGTDANPAEAERWFAKALVTRPDDSGFLEQYELYLAEKKNNPDAREAFLLLCSDAGYFPAACAIKYAVATNLYARREYEKAQIIFEELVQQGDPASACYLGKMYAAGQGGLPEDNIEAFRLYEIAASNNYAEAQYELARMYAEGRGTLEDADEAAKWYESAARNGHAEAQYQVAESEFNKAVFWLKQSANDDVDDGRVVEERRKSDLGEYSRHIARAMELYQKSAEQGLSDAQYARGRLFASGEGSVRDFKEAVRYYQMAAAQGHVGALFYLGLMYHAGLGVQKDMSKAIQCYEKSADKGHTGAQFYLGNCYRFGDGVARDTAKGEMYYKKVLNPVAKSGWKEADAEAKVSRMPVSNEWLSQVAREYGIVLWRKANSAKGFGEAKKWIGMAAWNGDVAAQDILIKMNIKDRRSYRRDAGLRRPDIPETQIDARADAVQQRREKNFLPLYLQEELKELYKKSDAKRNIVYVNIFNKRHTNVAGEGLWEMEVKYYRPKTRVAADFNGRILIGIEFADRKTGKTYWTYTEHKERGTVIDGDPKQSVSVYLNMNDYPDAKLASWAVMYGHLLDDDVVLAVFDSETKNRDRTLADIVRDNAGNEPLECTKLETVYLTELINN